MDIVMQLSEIFGDYARVQHDIENNTNLDEYLPEIEIAIDMLNKSLAEQHPGTQSAKRLIQFRKLLYELREQLIMRM